MSVVRNSITTHSRTYIKEHWTANTREELLSLFEREQSNYPTQGYGTTLLNVREDATGLLWHADFSRYTSCD